ncbi:hypothetical protein A167_00034 [Alcanivorax sp. S71-1-4]|uniref:hypothetical protein n=1 Tax=Alcanivorax sp. S71-1-4 TaxID=1177159 RepID=UPI00135B4539|nr:hypothetical protein [Alcanivorax sp. S71-1-4]KAF0811002.1 hypothetical protein A167_00034 [Alcanivorax sp. S71-1-4]
MRKQNLPLQDVRNDILQAIADITVAIPDIEALLERESSVSDDLFEDHDDVIEEVSERKIDWNSRYFHAHLEVAKRGHFSERRVRHLVDVREYLSSRNHKGFSVAANKVPINTDIAKPDGNGVGTLKSPVENSVSPVLPGKGADMNNPGNDRADIPPHIAEAIREPRLARTALEHLFYDSDMADPDLEKIFRWARKNVQGLLDEYEENVFSKGMNADTAFWSHDYFLSQLGYLEANFCEKRFLHLIAVRAYLRDVMKVPEFQKVVREPARNTDSSHDDTATRGRHEEKGLLDMALDIAEWGIGKFFDLVDYLKSKIR